jgi:ADP-L-glycero-D-manno-heptose 6-epimerase
MRILITGHKGFIGQNMVTCLGKEHDLVLYEWGEEHPSLDGVDQTIHLGAISSTTCTDEQALKTQNYDYSVWLISECVQRSIPIQVASSASVYGTKNVTFKETDEVDPQTLYAKSKAAIETFCSGLQASSPVQLFRYFNVYGPHEDHKGNQASPQHKFQEQVNELGYVKLFKGSENFYRDFVPVEYVIDVHKKFFAVEDSGVWNVGTGKPQSFFEVALSITDNIEWVDMPESLRLSYQKYTKANLEKLNQTLLKRGRSWQARIAH